MLRFLCIALLSALVSADTPYTSCGGTSKVVSFHVANCTTSPCIFQKGQAVPVTIVIISDVNSETITVELTGRIASIEIPLQTLDCSSFEPTSCSLVGGVEKTLAYTLHIPSYAPDVPVTATFLDDNEDVITCITVDAIAQ